MIDKPSSIPTSLSLRIGLGVFDGGDREWLANTFKISTDDVDQSWLRCREWLSKHFAQVDGGEYVLLDEAALRERLEESLRLLIDWRAQAMQDELFMETATQESPENPDD